MKALITNIQHYISLVTAYLTDREDEPLYYYLRFRVAVAVIVFLLILNVLTFREMRKWNYRADAHLEYNIELLQRNIRLLKENDMLADVMLSNGQFGIIQFYCDELKKWQEQQLRNADMRDKSVRKDN